MQKLNIGEYFENNPYPGRGILLGRSEDGHNAVVAYFLMGRSENSRNRILVEEGQGLRAQAFDESKVSDPSLILYAPVRVLDGKIIVTNGDQTDTVCAAMGAGESFEDALRTRTFEPDVPNYTPRISGLVETDGGLKYKLSILKSADGSPETVERQFFEYESPASGEGRLIHTYTGDGDPLPSFEGEPVRVALNGTIDEFTHGLWNALNEENRISLFVRFLSMRSGLAETRILNKNR